MSAEVPEALGQSGCTGMARSEAGWEPRPQGTLRPRWSYSVPLLLSKLRLFLLFTQFLFVSCECVCGVHG